MHAENSFNSSSVENTRRTVQDILSRFHSQLQSDYIPRNDSASCGTSSNAFHYESWIRGKIQCTTTPNHDGSMQMQQTDDYPTDDFTPTRRCQFFDQYGFLWIESFVNADTEVISMKKAMEEMVRDQWHTPFLDHEDDGGTRIYDENAQKEKKHETTVAIFRTDDKQLDAIDDGQDYFLTSACRVHFFAEKDALDTKGHLKDEFRTNKMGALNKVGHGIHLVPGPFYDYTTSTKVRDIVRELGWQDPCVPQSMYIFKQPIVGAEVTSHQDSTFLYTTPKQSCLGLWLALDDATLENGCLWVRPGSHREPLRRRFARNSAYFGEESIRMRSNIPRGDTSQSQMSWIQECSDDSRVTWDGKLPEGDLSPPNYTALFDAGFIPIECKAGDLILFPGTLDHLSLPNHSKFSRHTFQLHLVEGTDAGVSWSTSNWLQYPHGVTFSSLK